MTEETYFDKVCKSVENGLSVTHDLRWRELYELFEVTCETPQSLTPEQQEHLQKLAIKALNKGGQAGVIFLAGIISYGGYPKPAMNIETTIVHKKARGSLHPRSEFVHPFRVAVDIMEEAGVFEEDEEILLYENGSVTVNHGFGKRGVLVITNKRLLCLGTHMDGDILFHEDHEQRPYVWSIDILDIKKLKEIKEKKESIEAKYDTKYIRKRTIPIIHPLFYYNLKLKPKLKEGTVKIKIDMTALGPDKKTIRADKKRRNHELYTRIMQIIESGGPRPI